ncbi:hypothetical protein K788_0005320 [Paraburkholderia caribensis MBA4]|uniref:Uncharacterized protein n=1 Tax=Paraburkholderia caribensis MBA4 TaxID=1323664 RepID=A0A0P0RFR3_9BURK|nr:hypothetical protein K788_0005320 [Paraburkholderia caribensis MBA4]
MAQAHGAGSGRRVGGKGVRILASVPLRFRYGSVRASVPAFVPSCPIGSILRTRRPRSLSNPANFETRRAPMVSFAFDEHHDCPAGTTKRNPADETHQ